MGCVGNLEVYQYLALSMHTDIVAFSELNLSVGRATWIIMDIAIAVGSAMEKNKSNPSMVA